MTQKYISSQGFVCFLRPDFLLISNFTPLLSDKIQEIISDFYLLNIAFWLIMWPVLEKAPCASEKNVHMCWVEDSVDSC